MTRPRRFAGAVPGIVRTSLVYSVGAVAGKAIGIVLLPIMTRLLSPDDFGRVDIATTFATTVAVLAGFQLDTAVTRVYFDLPEGVPRRRLLGTFLTLLAVTTVPLVLISVVFRQVLSSILFGSPGFGPLVVGAALLVIGSVYRIAALSIARTTGRASDYARISGGSLILSGVLAVAFLSIWQATAFSAVLAYALAFALTAVVGIFILRTDVLPGLSKANASILARFGFPLVPAALAAIAADLINRTVLLQAGGASEVAYLGVALRFASIATLVLAAFQLAWQPRAYAIFESGAGRRQIAAESSAFLVLLSALALAMSALIPEGIQLLAGRQYEAAGPATSFALIAALGSAGFVVGSMPSLLARDTRSIGIAMGIGVAIGVLANLVLAPRFGSTGTAAAMAAGQSVAFAVVVLLGRAAVRLPTRWAWLGVTMGTSSILMVLFTELAIPLPLRMLTVALFILALALIYRPRRLLLELLTLWRGGNAPAATESSSGAPLSEPAEPITGENLDGHVDAPRWD